MKNAKNMSNVGMKQKSLKYATLSANKALELAPDSIEYAHTLCLVIFTSTKINREYQEVKEECLKV